MKIEHVIIGGGVAGLCAAIRLAELGEESILIESGSYPVHKVCGEFLSPECLNHLAKWNIRPIEIPEVVFNTPRKQLRFAFPSNAGGMSHYKLDPALVHYALVKGVKIMTNTQVSVFKQKQRQHETHQLQLSTNETIEAGSVIIAAGRFGHIATKYMPIQYKGFKAHYKLTSEISSLEMYSFPGAYLGISPIENGQINLACLAKREVAEKMGSEEFMNHLFSQNARLRSLLLLGDNLFDKWMVASVPSFGLKDTPQWLDTYFIGDAAFTIPPACGGGLSMAILGGRLAAEHALIRKPEAFKKLWGDQCSKQLFWARILHKLLLNPFYGDGMMGLSKSFPFIAKKLFALTRPS